MYELRVPYLSTLLLWKMLHNKNHMSSRATIPEYFSLGDTKALRVMSPSAFGIGWHNAPGLSCYIGANVLVLSRTLETMWYLNDVDMQHDLGRMLTKLSRMLT